MTVDWTPERIQLLTDLWNKGVATSEIGRQLDVTKNAVVGKVHRLGLPKRQSPIQRKAAARRKTAAKELITLDKLRPGMCAWPFGDPGDPDFHFCGKPAVEGKPYCAEHCDMAYVRGNKESDQTQEAEEDDEEDLDDAPEVLDADDEDEGEAIEAPAAAAAPSQDDDPETVPA